MAFFNYFNIYSCKALLLCEYKWLLLKLFLKVCYTPQIDDFKIKYYKRNIII
jgi:hypothetical protein